MGTKLQRLLNKAQPYTCNIRNGARLKFQKANGITAFEKTLTQELAIYGLGSKFGSLLSFTDKVLLVHSSCVDVFSMSAFEL